MNDGSPLVSPLPIAFVLEQSLGHVTYAKNLAAEIERDPEVHPTWLPISNSGPREARRLPLLSKNWSFDASYQTYQGLRRRHAPQAFGALFLHTQVTALFAAHLLRWGNGVVSLDATPRNYDAVGLAYGHQPGPPLIEAGKDALNRRAFHAARHLVTWSDWAKASLQRDYGVSGNKVTVIPPGTNLQLWQRQELVPPVARPPRLLFVGADFQRKGGQLLLEVYRHQLADRCELDVVTKAPVTDLPPGVRVFPNVAPNSAVMRELFATADIFVLPSRADCLAVVLMEAAAAGLPIVTTNVGALDEAILHGENGLVVGRDNGDQLAEAIRALLADPQRRVRMAAASYRLAQQRFDASKNARQLLGILKGLARSTQTSRDSGA